MLEHIDKYPMIHKDRLFTFLTDSSCGSNSVVNKPFGRLKVKASLFNPNNNKLICVVSCSCASSADDLVKKLSQNIHKYKLPDYISCEIETEKVSLLKKVSLVLYRTTHLNDLIRRVRHSFSSHHPESIVEKSDAESSNPSSSAQAITKLLNFLTDKNRLSTPNIFRVPGEKTKIKEYQKCLRKGLDLPINAKVHDICGTLKQQLQDWPFPHDFREIPQKFLSTDNEENVDVEILNLVDAALPKKSENQQIFDDLMRVLVEITRNSATNNMDINSLSICIGITLFPFPKEQELALSWTSKAELVTTVLIRSYSESHKDS